MWLVSAQRTAASACNACREPLHFCRSTFLRFTFRLLGSHAWHTQLATTNSRLTHSKWYWICISIGQSEVFWTLNVSLTHFVKQSAFRHFMIPFPSAIEGSGVEWIGGGMDIVSVVFCGCGLRNVWARACCFFRTCCWSYFFLFDSHFLVFRCCL